VIFCDLLRRFHEELASILTGHLSDWGMYMRLEDSRSIPDDHRTEGLVVTCLRSVATGLHAAAPAADLVGGVMMAGPVHRSARGPSGRRAPCRGMDLPEASTRGDARRRPTTWSRFPAWINRSIGQRAPTPPASAAPAPCPPSGKTCPDVLSKWEGFGVASVALADVPGTAWTRCAAASGRWGPPAAPAMTPIAHRNRNTRGQPVHRRRRTGVA